MYSTQHEDEEMDGIQTQVDTQTQQTRRPGKKAAHTTKSSDNFEPSEIVSKVVNFLMMMHLSNKTQDCSTENIIKYCFPEYLTVAEKKKMFLEIMEDAEVSLNILFGFELICDKRVNDTIAPIPHPNSQSQTSSKNGSSAVVGKDIWILLNQVDSDADRIRTAEKQSDEINRKRGVLITTLTYILLNGGSYEEEKLISQLDLQAHNVEENAQDLLKEFSSLGYIKRKLNAEEKQDFSKQSYELFIGTRSFVEIGLENMLKFIEQTCEVKLSKTEKETILSGIRKARLNIEIR